MTEVLEKKITVQEFQEMEFPETDFFIYELINGIIMRKAAPESETFEKLRRVGKEGAPPPTPCWKKAMNLPLDPKFIVSPPNTFPSQDKPALYLTNTTRHHRLERRLRGAVPKAA